MAERQHKELHEIFIIDPLKLKALVGQYVQLTLASGQDIFGIVHAIDPVSQSIILIEKEENFLNMKIILKNVANSVKVIPDIPNDLKELELADLFMRHNSKKPASEISQRKEKVKSWLMRHFLNVVEKGDVLVLDSLEIHPPYEPENCICSNTIVLDRIQTLLKRLQPGKNE